ncbi:THUMP domain-containing protein, partial [Wenyingzhuangia sp. 1_MG-2023]|nr:THUMP domain-containing protein [Wenyingzhuangia sp. 1_MG-2023]
VQDRWDSLVIEVNLSATEDIAMTHRHMVQILSHTPGIGYALEIDEHPFESLDQAYQLVREANRDVLEGKTFCVRVKRAGNHDFTSHD